MIYFLYYYPFKWAYSFVSTIIVIILISDRIVTISGLSFGCYYYNNQKALYFAHGYCWEYSADFCNSVVSALLVASVQLFTNLDIASFILANVPDFITSLAISSKQFRIIALMVCRALYLLAESVTSPSEIYASSRAFTRFHTTLVYWFSIVFLFVAWNPEEGCKG